MLQLVVGFDNARAQIPKVDFVEAVLDYTMRGYLDAADSGRLYDFSSRESRRVGLGSLRLWGR